MTQAAAPKPKGKSRIFELDVLRGFAILLMSTFHLVFDLMAYFGQNINIYSGFWFYVGRSSAILFMLVSGISSTLGGKTIRRGLMVLGCAMVVTVASIPIMGQNYIRFGILHFFGAVMLLKGLADKLLKSWRSRLIASIVLVPFCWAMGRVVTQISVQTFWFLPLGIMYPGFTSFDYYPIFPWAAWFCGGIAIGLVVYKNKHSLFRFDIAQPQSTLPKKIARGIMRPFAFLGRHSLLVYLLHQPLILGVLFLLSAINIL